MFSYDQDTELLMHIKMSKKKDDFTRVFLVRHAEKQSGSNPMLTEAGERRAQKLAQILEEVELTHVYSTDYNRTRATAAPIMEQLGLELELYDAKNLPAIKELITSKQGKISVVVGHSNTTPQLVNLFAGTNYPEIAHEDYSNLYLLTLKNNDEVEVEVFKF